MYYKNVNVNVQSCTVMERTGETEGRRPAEVRPSTSATSAPRTRTYQTPHYLWTTGPDFSFGGQRVKKLSDN